MSNLVLLPGLLCDEALWQHQVKALSGRINIQIPDLTQDDTVKGMAARVLATAPPTFMLGGLSMGGYVAMEIMRQAPERVEKLILIDTSARPDTEEQRRRRLGLLTLAQKGEFKGVTPRLLPLLLHPDHLADRILTQTIMQMASRIGRDGYLNQQRAIIGRVDSRPGLKNILCPTLVIVGREDTMTPPEVAEEMATLIPDAKLEIVEKSGHLPPLEQPLQITGMMKNFIADQGPV